MEHGSTPRDDTGVPRLPPVFTPFASSATALRVDKSRVKLVHVGAEFSSRRRPVLLLTTQPGGWAVSLHFHSCTATGATVGAKARLASIVFGALLS